MERGEQISQEEYLTLKEGQPIEIENIERWKANLIGNLDGAIGIIKNIQHINEEFPSLFENFYQNDLRNNFCTDALNEETMGI
jgi:hypothetical protein